MSAAQYNIQIEKYADFSRGFQVKEDDVVVDLTGYSFASEVREHPVSDDSTAFTTTIVDAAQGLFNVNLTDQQTAALEAGTQYYDIVMTDPVGNKTRILAGKAFISAGVTR